MRLVMSRIVLRLPVLSMGTFQGAATVREPRDRLPTRSSWVGPICCGRNGLMGGEVLLPQPIGGPNRDHCRIDPGDPGRYKQHGG